MAADVTPRFLEAFARSCRASVTQFWELDPGATLMRCIASWTPAIDGLDEFVAASRVLPFRRGVGLPGQVWESGEFEWIEEFSTDPNFPRAALARRCGIRTAIGVPIRSRQGVVGVIELFFREPQPFDADLRSALELSGAQIGLFLERQRALELLAASETRKAAILRGAVDSIITIDSTGRVLEFNPAAEAMFGYSSEDAVGRELAELIVPPEWRDQYRAGLARYVATGEGSYIGRRVEQTGMRADGSTFPIEIAVTRIDGSRDPTFTGFVRDLTEQQRGARARRLLAAVVNSADQPILSKSLTGVVTSWNAAAHRVYGYSADEMIGRPIWHVVPPDRIAELRSALSRVAQGEAVGPFETKRVRKDGRMMDIQLTISPVFDDAGTVVGSSTIGRDVTADVMARQTREAFIGVLSHELRTPITTIYAAAKVLSRQRELDPNTRRELLADLEHEADRTYRLVEDLLVLTRAERGGLDLATEPVNLQRLIPNVLASDLAGPPPERVRLQVPNYLPAAIGDPLYVEQVIRNLLGNALKYSPPEAHIDVVAWQAEGEIIVSIRDAGPGISAEEADQLFDSLPVAGNGRHSARRGDRTLRHAPARGGDGRPHLGCATGRGRRRLLVCAADLSDRGRGRLIGAPRRRRPGRQDRRPGRQDRRPGRPAYSYPTCRQRGARSRSSTRPAGASPSASATRRISSSRAASVAAATGPAIASRIHARSPAEANAHRRTDGVRRWSPRTGHARGAPARRSIEGGG